MYIKQAFGNKLQRKRTLVTETVKMMQRINKNAVPYGKEQIPGNLTWKNERSATAQTDGSFLVYYEFTTTVDELV